MRLKDEEDWSATETSVGSLVAGEDRNMNKRTREKQESVTEFQKQIV